MKLVDFMNIFNGIISKVSFKLGIEWLIK